VLAAGGLIGLIGALAITGCAAQSATSARPAAAAQSGTVQTCAAYAYQAIQRHEAVTGMPAACAGLSRAQVNQAASTAIRQAAGGGPKSAWRKQAGLAAPWVSALLTGQVPAAAGPAPAGRAGSRPGGLGLGGVSELAIQISALLAWLAAAASGGYVLLRWLLAGGSLRRRSPTAAPPAVTAGHAGFGLLGLVLWILFMVTGWAALAWTAVAILAPVAGLGMGVLALGLPSPRSPSREPRPQAEEATPAAHQAPAPYPAPGAATAVLIAPAAVTRGSRPRIPVLTIAAHGLFATTTLLLVLLAAIGAA
jgi:hypothetical protein